MVKYYTHVHWDPQCCNATFAGEAAARFEKKKLQTISTPGGGVLFSVTYGTIPFRQVCRRYEKPLVLQLCRLVRGFTHPASYFAGEGAGAAALTSRNSRSCSGGGDQGQDLALFSVDEFSAEMVGAFFEKVSVIH